MLDSVEPSTAFIALIDVVASVGSLMFLQVGPPAKRPSTLVALEWFYSTVRYDVRLQLVFPIELSHAACKRPERTGELLDRIVNQHVSFQLVSPVKRRITHFTDEGVFLRVDDHVNAQVLLRLEGFVADITIVLVDAAVSR